MASSSGSRRGTTPGGGSNSSSSTHVALPFADSDSDIDADYMVIDGSASGSGGGAGATGSAASSLHRPLLGPGPRNSSGASSTEGRAASMAPVGALFGGLVRLKRAAQERIAARHAAAAHEFAYGTAGGGDINSVPDTKTAATGMAAPQPRLSHLDRMTISPFDKFRRFGRVPVKFILAIGVVLALTSFYIVQNLQVANYIDGTTSMLRTLLCNSDDDGNGMTEAGGTILLTTEELHDHLKTAATNYFQMPNTSVTRLTVQDAVTLTWVNVSGTFSAQLTADNPVGPMNGMTPEELSAFLQATQVLAVRYSLRTEQWRVKGTTAIMDAEYGWDIRGEYMLGSSGSRAEYRMRVATTVLRQSTPTLVVLNVLIIVFALPSAVLTLKALYKSWFAYNYAKKHLSKLPKDNEEMVWARLNWQDKLAFFNLWHLTSVLGDIMLILGSCTAFSKQLGHHSDDQDSLSASDFMHALGGFLAWISLLKFYEWNAELYMLMLSVRASAGRVGKFILTVSPVYIAYAIVGVGCFYDHPRYFGNIFNSSRTIFSLINGDSILEVFTELQTNADLGYIIVGQLYIYTLGTVFIVTIMNVFVFIIESGYDAALQAVYGDDYELQVVIDHERLRKILQAAQANDPQGHRANIESELNLDALFPLEPSRPPSPSWRRSAHRRRRGRSNSPPMRRRAQSDATGLVGSDSSHRLIAQATGGEALLMTPARKDVPSVTLTVPDAAAAPISDSSRRAALLAEIQSLQQQLSAKIAELAALN